MKKKIEGTFAPGVRLEHLKKQAKSLLRDIKAKNPHALDRLKRANVDCKGNAISLTFAQRVIARENGVSTWADLKRLVESGIESADSAGSNVEISSIDQIWLDCKNLEGTDCFYGELLGLSKTGEVPGQMAFYDCGGVNLLLGLREEIRPNSILYLNCGNSEAAIQRAYNRLKEAGTSMGQSPHCIVRNWQGFDVWMAFFADPSGNQLAFKCNVPVS